MPNQPESAAGVVQQVSADASKPTGDQLVVLQKAHRGHWGLSSTMQLLKSWGVRIGKGIVQTFLDKCPQCQLYKRMPKAAQMGSLAAVESVGKR